MDAGTFAERTLTATSGFALLGGYPLDHEVNAIDHPLWEDATAVKMLLARAPAKSLVHCLRFMRMRNHVDPYYLLSLDSIDEALLATASHRNHDVREAFARILISSIHWPGNTKALVPLIYNENDSVVAAALRMLDLRKVVPADRRRLKELARSNDVYYVRDRAKSLLAIASSSPENSR